MKRKTKTKTKVKATIRINAYSIIAEAVEVGAALGVNRAYKHTDKPDREAIANAVSEAIMGALCDVLSFDEAG